jgi:hypothetical protein
MSSVNADKNKQKKVTKIKKKYIKISAYKKNSTKNKKIIKN